jgi:hypothetical protein
MRTELEIVRLKKDVAGVRKGTLGTVVMVSTEFPSQFLVEFPDIKGQEIILVTVQESDLEPGKATVNAEDQKMLSKTWNLDEANQ